MSSKTKSKADSLLAALQRTVPDRPSTAPQATVDVATETPQRSRAANRPRRSALAKTKGRGQPAQFWFHDEDRALVRELAAWVAGQGIRTTDSLVIRAALRAAKTGPEFLDAYRQASKLDGRLSPHKDDSAQSHETTQNP
jgi:hypothetical protein